MLTLILNIVYMYVFQYFRKKITDILLLTNEIKNFSEACCDGNQFEFTNFNRMSSVSISKVNTVSNKDRE